MNGSKTFFDKLMGILTKLGNVVMMNMLFLATCLPIVTIGQAWCALLSAVRFEIRGERWFEGFKFGFRNRFWRGIIIWCVMAVPLFFFLSEMNHFWQTGETTALISSSLVFALMGMFSSILLMLNVYIPTGIYDWLRNAATLVFQGHIFVLGAAALLFVPAVLLVFVPDVFLVLLIVFLSVYFVAAAYGSTILMKTRLITMINQARADGSLTAEEGRRGKIIEEEDDYDQ